MNHTDEASTGATEPSAATDSDNCDNSSDWAASLQSLLERAAGVAASHGCTADAFAQAALDAYMSKNPAFRKQLEAMHLANQLATLRAQGRIGIA